MSAALLAAALAPAPPADAALIKPAILFDDLNNPRGITFGPDGALYIAEAGLGDGLTSTGPCVPGPEGRMCLGPTGSVGRFADGKFTRVVDGLPSLARDGGHSAIGPSDVAFIGSTGILSMGLGQPPSVRGQLPAYANKLGKLLAFRASSPTLDIVDLARFEQQSNPDGGERDSNPQSVVIGPHGIVATDAGGNSLVRVTDPGAVSTLATFPTRMFSGIPMQSVPTGVVFHNGAYFVAELTGFPFPVGAARIYKVVPGQKPQVYASGLTNVIDLAFDANGTLYALEIAHNSLLNPHPVGALLKIRPGQSPELLANINMPGGMTIKGGFAYVTDCAVCTQTGRILRFKL